MKYLLLVSVTLAAFSIDVVAQTAHVGYTPGTGNVVTVNRVLPNLACAPTTAQINPYNPVGFGFGFIAGTVLGGYALDQDHDLAYVSDGFLVHVCANPLFFPTTCGGGPPVGLVFPVPLAVVTPPGTPFGALTGLAVGHDVWTTSPSAPCTDILFMTNGESVMGIDVRPPHAVVIPPWVAPGVFPQVLTGLEYGDAGGSGTDYLWANDAVGNTFIYTVTGILVAGPFPVIGPPPVVPVVGNVLDRSTCPPGYWVTNGQFLYPSVFANPTIPLNAPAAAGLAFGASFSAEPVLMAGRCGSTCNPFPTITTDEPICDGKNITFILSGAPPGTPAMFAADLACTPGFAIFGCTWWLSFGPWAITSNTFTNAFGIATAGPYPLPAASCPGLVGVTGYAQWVYLDPCAIGGFGITDALHMRLSNF